MGILPGRKLSDDDILNEVILIDQGRNSIQHTKATVLQMVVGLIQPSIKFTQSYIRDGGEDGELISEYQGIFDGIDINIGPQISENGIQRVVLKGRDGNVIDTLNDTLMIGKTDSSIKNSLSFGELTDSKFNDVKFAIQRLHDLEQIAQKEFQKYNFEFTPLWIDDRREGSIYQESFLFRKDSVPTHPDISWLGERSKYILSSNDLRYIGKIDGLWASEFFILGNDKIICVSRDSQNRDSITFVDISTLGSSESTQRDLYQIDDKIILVESQLQKKYVGGKKQDIAQINNFSVVSIGDQFFLDYVNLQNPRFFQDAKKSKGSIA